MSRFKGVIFDFNGVLLWDAALQEESWQWVAQTLRGQALSAQEFDLHVHGRTTAYTLSYLSVETQDAPSLEDWVQRKEAYYRQLCLADSERFVLSPRAMDLFEFLCAQQIPHTIATASEGVNLEFFIEYLQLARWFERSQIVFDDGTIAAKPAPDMYALAAARLGLAPQDCIVVEDAISGFLAAQRAHIGHVIALGAPENHDKLAKAQGVDAVIESLWQFPRNMFG